METRQSKKNDDAPPVEVAQPVADSKDSGNDEPTMSDLFALIQAQSETLQAQGVTLRAQGVTLQATQSVGTNLKTLVMYTIISY